MALTLWLSFNGYRLTAITDCLMGKVKARLSVAAKARAQQRRRFLLHHQANQAYHRVRC
jgi:prophage maintenance system killer protein